MTFSIVSKDQLCSTLLKAETIGRSDEQLLNKYAFLDDKQVSLGDDLIKILQIRSLVKQLEDQTVKDELSVLLDKHSLRLTQEELIG